MTWVLGGSFAGGLAAYLFHVLAARRLGSEAFAPIGVLWTLQYLLVAVVLISVEANLTRTVTLADGRPGALGRPLRTVATWLGVTALLTATATYAARGPLFGGLADLAFVAGLLVVSYGAFVTLRGWLAGNGRFRSYGAVTGLESIARLAVALPVLALVPTTRALAWVLPVGPLAMLAWWLRERRKPPPDGPPAVVPPAAPLDGPSTARSLAATTTGNATAQLLLASGPLAIVPLGAAPAEVAVFFTTVTVARVPLVFALNGVLSRLLPPFVRLVRDEAPTKVRRLTATVTAGTAVAAAVAGLAAAWLGPPFIRLFFGAAFGPPAWLAALAAATVTLACGALVLNQLLIAMQAETRLVAPWLVALAAGVALAALLPGSPTFRVGTGFAFGELSALLGLAVVTSRGPYPSEP